MAAPPDPFLAEMGRRIARRRADLQLSQVDVAAFIRMSQGQLSNLEAGRHARMQLSQLAELARVLRTSTDYLLQLRGPDDRGEIPNMPCPGAQDGAIHELDSQYLTGLDAL